MTISVSLVYCCSLPLVRWRLTTQEVVNCLSRSKVFLALSLWLPAGSYLIFVNGPNKPNCAQLKKNIYDRYIKLTSSSNDARGPGFKSLLQFCQILLPDLKKTTAASHNNKNIYGDQKCFYPRWPPCRLRDNVQTPDRKTQVWTTIKPTILSLWRSSTNHFSTILLGATHRHIFSDFHS